MKNKFYLIFIFVLFSFQTLIIAQSNDSNTDNTIDNDNNIESVEEITVQETTDKSSIQNRFHQISGFWLWTLGPQLTVNTQKNSAPSPIKASLGFGIQLPLGKSFVSFIPHLDINVGYYLWNNNMALPAEIENRTAIVPSIMLDLPISCTLKIKTSLLSLGIGISVLARYGFLSTGVPENDRTDVAKINSDFWKNLNWLYPSLHISFDRLLSNGVTAGAGIRGYIPIGALINNRGFDTAIISLEARFALPKK